MQVWLGIAAGVLVAAALVIFAVIKYRRRPDAQIEMQNQSEAQQQAVNV